METMVRKIAEACAILIEGLGISIITVLAFYALLSAAADLLKKESFEKQSFRQIRQRLGRSILLGLEFLVAADIIHTVAVELTYKSVTILAAIILIRTFLSFTLEVELTGKWPWQG